MLAVYAIVNGNQAGWTSGRTLGLLAAAAACSSSSSSIEARVAAPLMPLRLFRLRNVATANVVGMLWAAAMFAWFFLSALYLQLVLGYSPLQVGLAFLPANVIMAAFSLGLSAKLVMRFGIRRRSATGLLLAAAGLALFARAPVDGNFVVDVLPSMILLGFGAGMAFNPVLLAAMSDVEPEESGLASGIVNTSFMMGGALGLADAGERRGVADGGLAATGDGQLAALTGGYHVAFLIGAVFAARGGDRRDPPSRGRPDYRTRSGVSIWRGCPRLHSVSRRAQTLKQQAQGVALGVQVRTTKAARTKAASEGATGEDRGRVRLDDCQGGAESRGVSEGSAAASEALTPERPRASARRLILPLALAQFICSFAGSNMNVMINDISEDLDTTVKGVQTAITLFLLIMAILMIPCSKLTDRWGRKRCFMLGPRRCTASARC